MKKNKPFPYSVIAIIFLLCPLFINAQNEPSGGAAAINSADEFRLGIHAFNRFAYNEAILSFERALSFRPGEPLILDWLGKAYYRSGFEDTALQLWRTALDIYGRNTGSGLLLWSRIETVTNRRSLLPVANDQVRYIESGRYPGMYNDIVLYRQPTSILSEKDGSVWVTAYGSNELVRIDVNGVIRDRRRGPINGFDRPYDLVRGLDGRMYVSEFRGGRISILDRQGNWLGYIGSKGIKEGMLVGPQNLTIDEDGYLYVVEYGNRRVSKFDPDGKFILCFGAKSAAFSGFMSPTGIAACNGKVYVSDNVLKAIFEFDPNGSYLDRLAAEDLKGPESLKLLGDGKLLACDNNRIILIDTSSAIVRELGLAGGEKVRIRGLDMDKNGCIAAARFESSEVSLLTRFDDRASGLFVQIRDIQVERFPQVTVNLTVEDRLRRPIVGLDFNNFLVTEGGYTVSEQTLVSSGFRYQGADVSIMVEQSDKTLGYRDELAAAARDVNRALTQMGNNSKIVSFVSAGVQPQKTRFDVSVETAARGTAAQFSPQWRFDLGLRLAAVDLLAAAPKRSIVYIGSGDPGEFAFEQYSLSELACYLANNNIVFNAIITGTGQAAAAIEYLCKETGGKAQALYRPQGIGEMIKSITDTPSGWYSISFRSSQFSDFGRAWLPLEVEVYLMERSGRDNTGYYPPLE